MPLLDLPPVYPITDKRLSGRSTHREIVRELLRGGARLVQIRDKETPPAELLDDLRRTVELAERARALVLVNDRVDLALASNAHGVHLGQRDLPPDAARRILPPRSLIGFSTHNLRQLKRAAAFPVDYLGFGPIFPTATKERPDPVVGLPGLRRACSVSARPVVAIGGITLENLREVLETGAASVAVIGALMRERNLARRMDAFLRAATARPRS